MADQDQDKTEEATPFKLQEAKRRGQVWKSMEINSLMLLSAALAIVYGSGDAMTQRLANLAHNVFSHSGQIDLRPSQTLALFELMVRGLVDIFWPFMAVIVTVGILANIFQTGPVFSFFPLKPDFNRLSPAQGLKRLISGRMLFEAVKSVLKLLLFGAVIYFALVSALPGLLGLLDIHPKAYVRIALDHTYLMAFKLLAVLLVIAFLDLIFSRWDYSKRMRMSRRELKDDIKRREGDPQIRAKLRELQREAARRAGSVRRVPEADVLITNPTRLAVALKYERGNMAAPQVIAKGAGDLAAKMREVARNSQVPIVENKPLARALFKKTDIDQPICEELFPKVAKILAWVYSMRRMRDAWVTTG